MTEARPGAGTRPQHGRRTALAVLGGLLGVGGLALVGFGVAEQQPAPPQAHDIPAVASTAPSRAASATPTAPGSSSARPSSAGSTAARPRPTQASPSAGAASVVLAESEPTDISIPAIGVSSGFEELGIGDNGEMEAPSDPSKVGWFTGAHTPGAPGVSVVAGHVTWNREPTVFFKLGQLQRGDEITVTRRDGSRATFGVQRMSTFPKDAFPSNQVYAASDTPQLVLITCGGAYSQRTHSYDSNVIVWADPVKLQPATGQG